MGTKITGNSVATTICGFKGGKFGLARTGVRELDLTGCPVVDLSPLAGTRMNSLKIIGCPVADLSPLADLPIHTIDVTPGDADPAVLARIGRLELIRIFGSDPPERLDGLITALRAQGRHRAARLVESQQALRRGDTARLRQLAGRYGSRLLLDVGAYVSLAEARAYARRHGARLPCLTDVEAQQALAAELRTGITTWIGLSWDAARGGLRWDDGSPLVYRRIGRSALTGADGIVGWYLFQQELGNNWLPENRADFTTPLVLEWDAW